MGVGLVVLIMICYWVAHPVTFSVDGWRFDCFTAHSNEGNHEADYPYNEHYTVVPVIFSYIAGCLVQYSVKDVVTQAGYGTVLIYYSALEEDVTITYVIIAHSPSS